MYNKFMKHQNKRKKWINNQIKGSVFDSGKKMQNRHFFAKLAFIQCHPCLQFFYVKAFLKNSDFTKQISLIIPTKLFMTEKKQGT